MAVFSFSIGPQVGVYGSTTGRSAAWTRCALKRRHDEVLTLGIRATNWRSGCQWCRMDGILRTWLLPVGPCVCEPGGTITLNAGLPTNFLDSDACK